MRTRSKLCPWFTKVPQHEDFDSSCPRNFVGFIVVTWRRCTRRTWRRRTWKKPWRTKRKNRWWWFEILKVWNHQVYAANKTGQIPVLQSIKSQTVRGSRTKFFSRVASGNLVTRYGLNKAPVYRERFPVNGRYVSVPEKRAVRISSERVSLLNSDGNLCLLESSSVLRSLKTE